MMKKFFFLLGIGAVTIMAQASNRYVTTTGDDDLDGKSWATAFQTIQKAVDACSKGDTVWIAAGTYNQKISIHDGVHVFGSITPASGLRSLEATPTILDGAGLTSFLLVKYDSPCTQQTTIDGLILQNAEHAADGGGAFLRTKCVLNNSIIRNCITGGGGGGFYNEGGTISNCLIELCEAASSGGGFYTKGGLVENCIIRGCQGKYAAARVESNAVVRNCVFYNNSENADAWPASGGVYNPGGTVYNCTFANNRGAMYAGSHSEKTMYNCVFWNNKSDDGFNDPSTYIASASYSTTTGSSHNVGDSYFEAKNFITAAKLAAENTAAKGPNFVSPSTFVGAPKDASQIAIMQAADFSLLSTSPLLNIARETGAPSTDINGVARPKGSGYDVGAYEYDPDAPTIRVQGINLNVDTLFVVVGSTNAFAAIFTPANATNRKLTWWIQNKTIATIDTYGGVTGVKEGQTLAAVKTADGGFTDTAVVVVTAKPIVIIHPEVLRADSLYKIEDYTIPSYIPMWAAKEAARKDSCAANIQALRDKIKQLVTKQFPYCLIANINGDPKTRMAFTWFTNQGITNGKVQLVAKANATAADFEGAGVISLDATATTTKALRYAVSTSGIIKATGMESKTAYTYESHKVIAEGLTPGTTYCYRVGYDTYWSEIATFQTAASKQGEFSFLLMSDSHIQDQEYVDNARWCSDAAIKNVPEAKFCLFPGDAEETGTSSNSEWEWERWFEEGMRPALYKMPFVVTDGNHEDTPNGNWNMHYNTDWAFNEVSIVKPQFKGITYSFVYGDVLFLVFSMQDYWRGTYSEKDETSVYLTRDVGNWFREQVTAHPECKYRISVCHKNIYSGSGHQEDEETPIFRSTMLPIFADCQIDLALQGHDHCYEVIGPVEPWSRSLLTNAIDSVKKVSVDKSTNMTGLEGGKFTVDDGTLYFIGATCGRKRYYPYTREEMDANITKHRVTNYYDLFSSKFGQPGSPAFTKVTVKSDGIYLDTYQVTDDKGNAKLFNSIKVVRNKPHTPPTGYEIVTEDMDKLQSSSSSTKMIHNGQLFILRDGQLYNAQGLKL